MDREGKERADTSCYKDTINIQNDQTKTNIFGRNKEIQASVAGERASRIKVEQVPRRTEER